MNITKTKPVSMGRFIKEALADIDKGIDTFNEKGIAHAHGPIGDVKIVVDVAEGDNGELLVVGQSEESRKITVVVHQK